jgi:hypothetical protein
MQPFQDRVVDEKLELDDKLSRLNGFLSSPGFASLPDEEKKRLDRQREVMHEYSEILRSRIAAFQ